MSDAVVVNRVRRGFYQDSVALMRIAQALSSREGVAEAALMIGTPANHDLLRDAGLLAAEGAAATPGDLVIAVRAAPEALEAALAEAERLLAQPAAAREGAGAEAWRPRTLHAARQVLPDANLALISVSGAFAAEEARRALRAGLHVMLFSDNVALADEVALKREARERGLLVMGPDCGTAVLAGTALGFANRVPRGPVGIVAASGTGLQEVAALIARGGSGVSHGIGTGGRDLHAEVGAATTLAALAALDRDPDTRHVVLISKPPAPEVAGRVVQAVGASGKPHTICFVGLERMEVPPNARLAPTLRDAAESALGRPVCDGLDDVPLPPGLAMRRGRIRGLFAGGTLCAEAQVLLRRHGHAVASNAPVPGALAVGAAAGEDAHAHTLLDLGTDEHTRGRPHPMIAPELRDAPLREALADPGTAVVLLDVVLGYGAHEDPAGAVTAVLAGVPQPRPPVVASVCGVPGDPQGWQEQVQRLESEGVLVAPSNAHAAELALRLVAQ